MPIDSSTAYIPLDGSSRGGCFGQRSTLERGLIFIVAFLALVVITLSIAFAYKRCEDSHVTTQSPTSTSTTTDTPSPVPTTKPSNTTTKAPPNNSTTSSAPTKGPPTPPTKAPPTNSTTSSPPTKAPSTNSTTSSPPSKAPPTNSTKSMLGKKPEVILTDLSFEINSTVEVNPKDSSSSGVKVTMPLPSHGSASNTTDTASKY